MSGKTQHWRKRFWFLMAVLLAVPVGFGGGYLAWASTDYTELREDRGILNCRWEGYVFQVAPSQYPTWDIQEHLTRSMAP